ncbi:MAG: hypothetical protein PHR96_03495 [Clostridia bacterium]|nr:hypothetical protein [Clostridia bacterium]
MENNVSNQNALFRKNFFNRFNSKQTPKSLAENLKKYNDSPPLDENVLKEMASAYSTVLSKYGYTVQPDNNFQPHLFAHPNNQNNNQTTELQSNVAPNQAKANITSEQPLTNQIFDNNLDYLNANLLNGTTFPDYTNGQLQITNNLLTEILNELRIITCMIECNRRRRLS